MGIDVFDLPFAEQADYFLRKLDLPTRRWDDIKGAAHDRAFIVAGAMKADLLADLKAAIARHKAGGAGLEGFRREFDEIVARHGWTGWTGSGTEKGRAWRARTIFETNLRTSYAAGRHRQLTESGIKYWMYKHNDLVARPRQQHLAWNGLVLPANHPFWQTHYPPNGWGCRCRVVGVSRPEHARRLGGDPDKAPPEGWDDIDPKTGAPAGIGRGWGHAPGANAATPLRELIEQKLFNLPAPIGAAMWESLKPALALEQRLAMMEFVDAAAASMRPANRAVLAHVAAPATVADLAARQTPLLTADIWLRDAELIHALREAKDVRGATLSMQTWRDLPALLETATPYLDTQDTGLIYVFDAPEGLGKVAARVNYASKVRDGEKRDRLTSNFIRTGGLVETKNIFSDARYVELKK